MIRIAFIGEVNCTGVGVVVVSFLVQVVGRCLAAAESEFGFGNLVSFGCFEICV